MESTSRSQAEGQAPPRQVRAQRSGAGGSSWGRGVRGRGGGLRRDGGPQSWSPDGDGAVGGNWVSSRRVIYFLHSNRVTRKFSLQHKFLIKSEKVVAQAKNIALTVL